MVRKLTLISLCLLNLMGCAGEDYDPVYFPSSQKEESLNKKPPEEGDFDLSQARCPLELTAKLCVQIKGDNIEVGTKPESPLCADTPPIPLEIEGEKISLKGNDFPDVNVSVDIRGIATPMTINGKGDGDGTDNIGVGQWTPDGNILIQNFSFFINVLGMSGEIPESDLTTDKARRVPELPMIEGSPAQDSGEIKLVTATVLGSLFPAADEYLLGASLQATFEGKLNPPLSECVQADGSAKKIKIVKLRSDLSGNFVEEPLPAENILEVSQGTTIAQGPTDVGPHFEATAHFKAISMADKPISIEMPVAVGPFYFFTEGTTHKILAPSKSFSFTVTFRPTTTNTPEAEVIKEHFSLGGTPFELMGIALSPQGEVTIHQLTQSGETLASNIETLNMETLFVSATPARVFFRCQTVACQGEERITQCQPCAVQSDSACTLQTVNAQKKPLEEVKGNCEPLYPNSAPQLQLNLSGPNPLTPSRQMITIQNKGVTDLEIKRVAIEELPNSRSRGEFQLGVLTLPVTLPPEPSTVLRVVITYLPKDLIGFDGTQPQAGQAVTDKATLVIETDTGTRTLPLVGKTKIQETPPLKALFGTPTGFKTKLGGESFAFEEVTQTTQDLAYPLFLNVSETAAAGVRITEIKIQGEDDSTFEWLKTQEEVEQRTPANGAGKRCSIPIFDPNTGRLLEEQFDLTFVSLGSQGFDLKPGIFSMNNLPLFGCVNFHRDSSEGVMKKIFKADLIVSGYQLDSQGRPLRNSDGSFRNLNLTIHLIAAIDPIKGKMVLRISQTVAAILNPQAPSLTAVPSKKEVEQMLSEGRSSSEEAIVLLGSLILDPFDEMAITGSRGEAVSLPGDGITGVFRALDTRPTPASYDGDPFFDFATLLHDSDRMENKGIFYDYDFPDHPLPDLLHVNGWRIFTGALSYPGPLSPRSPISRSECEVIDPCSPEGLRQFNEAGIGTDGKGACAFFYTSGGRYHSPAFEPVIRGEAHNLCEVREQPQEILDMNSGHYHVDGSITFEDLGLRFWGPTYIHNPQGPLGFKPPLDEIFHTAFTTEMLKPASGPNEWNVLPDEKIDIGRQEFKLNLSEEDHTTPAICPKNMGNRRIRGHTYSSWRYFAPLLFKDEAGEIPAGCPEGGFNGGLAYLKGRRIDPETKVFTIVTTAKFGSRENLSLAFKNIMIFFALNGWVCDPQGRDEDFEGARCFEPTINERDEKAKISIIGE